MMTLYIDSTELRTDMCNLGEQFNTDKSPYALNSICSSHRKGYTAPYSLLLSHFKNKNIVFAEIGIEAGASLEVWSRWFSSNAEIHAFEYEQTKIDACKRLDIKNIIYHLTDVTKASVLDNSFKNINKMFDVIIDDSAHETYTHNIKINTLHKYLNPGGILIIEDIQREEYITNYNIDTQIWEFFTFIICHHDNRYCHNNDKILYLVKK